MATALSLWFEEALEQRIRSAWSELQNNGVTSPIYNGLYRPHLTLGIWDFGNIELVKEALRGVLGSLVPIGLRFETVGQFPGEEGVTFLAPVPDTALFDMHAQVHGLCLKHGSPASSYYAPGRWVPHCTMTWKVSRREVLLVAEWILSSGLLPLQGFAVTLGLVDTPAEVELGRIDIGGAINLEG